MDYFKGSIDAPREILINRWYEIAGEPKKGNSLFTRAHFFDTVDDARYVCLTLDNAKQFVEDFNKYRQWFKRRDCNKKMRGFGVDLSDAAEELGMQGDGTLGIWSLAYDSRNLSSNVEKRLAGYHATPLVWTWEASKGNFFPYVVQPKSIWGSGVKKGAVWQTPEQEVIFWVSIGGI